MTAVRGPQKRLPTWASAWADGLCGCGARIVTVECMQSDTHLVCAKTGWDTDKCPDRPEAKETE